MSESAPNMPSPVGSSGRLWRNSRFTAEVLALIVVFGLLAIYVSRSMYGIDVWWHIKAGELIVDTGSIPSVDTFSAVDPEREWTPFQWLYEVIVYGLDEMGGLVALRVVHSSLLVAAFALLYLAFRREVGPAFGLFVLVVSIALFEDRFRVRPHVFNLFFLATLLPVLFGRWKCLRWPGLLGVGVVSWLWANIHGGGALLVPVALGGLLGGAGFRWFIIDRSAERKAEFLAATRLFVVAVLPMLLMPGFLHGVWTAITMYGASVDLIPEWEDPTAYFERLNQRGWVHHTVSGIATYATMTVLGIWVIVGVLRKRMAQMPWAEIAVSVLFLYLAQRSLRFIYLNVFPITLMLRDLSARSSLLSLGDWRRWGSRVAAVLLAVGICLSSYHYNIVVQRGSLAKAIERIPEHVEPGRFPVKAADFLAEVEAEGKIFHLTAWGGYLLYRLWPRCSVFADGRGNFDLVQVGTMVATHGRHMQRAEMLEKAWRLYEFDIIVFSKPAFPLMDWARDDWVRVYASMDPVLPVEVFLRNVPRNEATLERVRVWYGARFQTTFGESEQLLSMFRLLNGTVREQSQAISLYWGWQWLSAPKRKAKLDGYNRELEDGPGRERLREVLRERGLLYLRAGCLKPAHHDLQLLTDSFPDEVIGAHYLGWTLLQLGDDRAAGGALQEAFRRERALDRPILAGDERERGAFLINEISRRLQP